MSKKSEKRPKTVQNYLIKNFDKMGLEIGDHVLYDAFGGVFENLLSNLINIHYYSI